MSSAAAPVAAVALSVVTPSAGRVPAVLRKLEALAAQTLGAAALEVVLVDNACPDGVGDAVAARDWPFGLQVLRASTRLPAAEARAWAGRAARGRWLWWSDDDAVPATDAAARHLDAQRRRPGVTVGSVRFVDPALPTTQPAPRWTARRAGPAQVTGVNTVLVRDRYLAVVDRLPRLPRPYGGEDALVGFALQAAGEPFTAVPDAWVDHIGPWPARTLGDAEKAYDAGFNAAVLAAAYPAAAWPLGVHPWALLGKRALLAWPWGTTSSDARRRWRFERAYLKGAQAGRRAPPTVEVPA